MVMNRNGRIGGAPVGFQLTAGATIFSATRSPPSVTGAPPSTAAASRPITTSARAEINCSELM